MKVYRCTVQNDYEGDIVSWHSSKLAADKCLLAAQKERGEEANGPEGVEAVEIPSDKAGLISWLNIHFTRDNG